MRKVYTLVMYLLLPVVLIRWLWKSRHLPEYRHRIAERLACCRLASADVWVHAVSMGEVVAATPLIERLIAQNMRVLMTTMTPTGSQQITARFKAQISHHYIPYDLPQFFRRFFKLVRPKIAIIMETELWPNMVYEAHRAGVPLVLANARLSDRAYAQYHRMRWFFAPILAKFALIGTQSELDSHRYQALGASPSNLLMLGNMKFDLGSPQTNHQALSLLKSRWGSHRPVLIAASTHADEEEQLLLQLPKIRQAIPSILLVLVPRRPQRFQTVYKLAQDQGWNVGLRSQIETIQPANEVVILDSMGELLAGYGLSDYAFVGGSLIPIGGHNVLEPIAMEVPVFCGQYMQNSRSICDELIKNKALQMCASAEDFADKLIATYRDAADCSQQIQRASAVLHIHCGAVERYWKKIEEILYNMDSTHCRIT